MSLLLLVTGPLVATWSQNEVVNTSPVKGLEIYWSKLYQCGPETSKI